MSEMRKLIEAVEAKEITEGKYGPHGMGRRVNDGVDNIFDKRLQELGNDPTVEEIYDAMRNVRRDLAAEELMGFPRTNDYINKQFLGLVAETLELPGLYSPSGSVFYSVEKDDAGRYTGSGGASRQVAQELAEKGYLSPEAAERLGVTSFLGIEIGDRNSDSANAARDAQTMASGRRNVRRQVSRFMELLAKRNTSDGVVTDGVVYESALARLLTEALTREEEAEFQELLATIKDLPLDAYQDDQETLDAVRTAQQEIERIAPPAAAATAAEPAAAAATAAEPAAASSNTNNIDGALNRFANSGKGGLANDPDEEAAIIDLQRRLAALGWPLEDDGKYGPATKRAVSGFQTMMGATADGDAGPETIRAIIQAETIPGIREFYNDTNELIALIEKGAMYLPTEGATEGGTPGMNTRYDQFSGGNTRELPAGSIQNSSIDFRSLISIVETALFEAATEQEQARAMELYNKHKTKYESDAEYQAGLPATFQERLVTVFEWTKTNYISNLAMGDGDAAAAAEPAAAAAAAGDTAAGTATGGQPRPTESGVQGDYARSAWDALFDGYLDPATGNPLPNGRVPARPAAPTAQQMQQGTPDNGPAWDRTWGATHNPNGTPK